jgi:TMEM175 potassium channel family protein
MSSTPPPPQEGDEAARYAVGRLLALSDGVFAIALTLLTLSLQIDRSTPRSGLNSALADLGPEFYAYALSLLVIGAFWTGHHRLYHRVVSVDGLLLWLNVAFLGLVALIPFPTDLLGRYGDQAGAVALYGAAIGVGALVSVAMARYIDHHRLTSGPPRPWLGSRPLPIAVVFLASVPIAFVSPTGAQLCWLAAIPLRVASRRWTRPHPTPS